LFQSPTHASTHRHHRSKHQSDGQTLSHSHTVTTSQQQSSHHSSSHKHKDHSDSGKHRSNGIHHSEVYIPLTSFNFSISSILQTVIFSDSDSCYCQKFFLWFRNLYNCIQFYTKLIYRVFVYLFHALTSVKAREHI
jgi:hypothetical protein